MEQEQEIWKPVVGYEGQYEVSDMGRVKSLKYGKEKILKPIMNSKGYLRVGLIKDGKRQFHRIHRLVAQAFIPNPNNLAEVNHISEDKQDNRKSNLCWMTHLDNVRYGSGIERQTIKRGKPVLCIDLNIVYKSMMEAARQLGLKQSWISECCYGRRKMTHGYHWQFA